MEPVKPRHRARVKKAAKIILQYLVDNGLFVLDDNETTNVIHRTMENTEQQVTSDFDEVLAQSIVRRPKKDV